MVWQNATALRMGSGSLAFSTPASPRICFESALMHPMSLDASSALISCS
ncbi:MAG: hypothetical protein WCK32_03495 [Chlorobiaceae bacterium]